MKSKMIQSSLRRSVRSARSNAAIELLEPRRLLSGEVFVTDATAGTVQEYDSSGNLLNAQLISGLTGPFGIAISGSDLFVASQGTGETTGTVGEYTTSGATVNASLITGLTKPTYISISGAALFVSSSTTGVSEYTTTGQTANPSLGIDVANATNMAVAGTDLYINDSFDSVTHVYDLSNLSASGTPNYLYDLNGSGGVAVSGSNVFIGTTSGIAEYTTAGASENPSLTGTSFAPVGLTIAGSNLFVLEQGSSSMQGFNYQTFEEVAEYDTSGNPVAEPLVPVTDDVLGAVAVAGSDTSSTINQLAIVQQPTSASNGALSEVKVYIEDANGNVVTSDNSNVTLVLNNPGDVAGAELSGTATVAAVNGVATFDGLSVSATGDNYTLSAKDGADAPTTSLPFNVTTSTGGGGGGGTGGGSAYAAFVQQPSSAVAGAKMPSIEVTLESATGATATTSKSKVTLTIASGPSGGKIIGSTSQSPKAGTATFKNLKFEKAGTYTLEAIASGFSSADSSTITITAGAVKKAVFNPEPANVAAATPFNVAVELTDAYGNEAGDGDTVTLSLQSHPKDSTLAGDLTATASDGTADLDDLTLAAAGDYSLKATDGKAKAISSKFIVT